MFCCVCGTACQTGFTDRWLLHHVVSLCKSLGCYLLSGYDKASTLSGFYVSTWCYISLSNITETVIQMNAHSLYFQWLHIKKVLQQQADWAKWTMTDFSGKPRGCRCQVTAEDEQWFIACITKTKPCLEYYQTHLKGLFNFKKHNLCCLRANCAARFWYFSVSNIRIYSQLH